MKILKLSKNNKKFIIKQTLHTLETGGLVVFPSDTVYGLLVDATNEKAVKKLIQFKNRPPGKAVSVFCNFDLASQLVTINDQQLTTLKQIVPGPYTVILPSKHKVNKLLESEKRTLGIRIPMYRYIELLVSKFNKPITATSANLAGRPPHYSVETLLKELSNKQKKFLDLIIDAGTLPRNKPSTIVDLSQSDVKILRQGDLNFLTTKKFISKSIEETKRIAHRVISSEARNLAKRDKPLVFIIEGEMGVGKTVFVKGIGKKLGIDNIVSPTFVIYYEYIVGATRESPFHHLLHIDLYNIENKDEFTHLGLEKFLKPGNILCFEWGEKAGEIINLLKSKGEIVYIKMKYVDEKTREIEIKN